MTSMILAALISGCAGATDLRPAALVDKEGETWFGVVNAGDKAKLVCFDMAWDAGSPNIPIASPHSCRHQKDRILLPGKARIYKRAVLKGHRTGGLEFQIAIFGDQGTIRDKRWFTCVVNEVTESPAVERAGSMRAVAMKNHQSYYVGFNNITSSFLSITSLQTADEPLRACDSQFVFLVPPNGWYLQEASGPGIMRYRRIHDGACGEPIAIDFAHIHIDKVP